jgi:hypothetical protein
MEGNASDNGVMFEGEFSTDVDEALEHIEDILYLFRFRPAEVIQEAIDKAIAALS